MNKRTLNEGFNNCMRELYQFSIPIGNWDELLATSPKNEEGQIVVPFNDYEISEVDFDYILQKHIKYMKLSKPQAREFSVAIMMGPSPKYEINNNEI